MKELTVIGTVYVDIKGYPLGNFVPAGRNAGRVEQFHGGVGRNIAEDIANLGEKVAMVGLVDKGGIGDDVVKHLAVRGVNTDYLLSTADGMGTWLAIFDEKGDVCANISKRPNLLPICDVLEEHQEKMFADSKGLLLEMDIDEEIVAKAMELAEKHNIPVYGVISNISIAMERMAYIKKLDCFICNRQESSVLFNIGFETELKYKTVAEMQGLVAHHRAKLGLKKLIVTLDAEGSVYAGDNGEQGFCPAHKVDVVDTTGAGDSFFAGVSVGLSQGKSLLEACELGTAVAAKVVGVAENVYLP